MKFSVDVGTLFFSAHMLRGGDGSSNEWVWVKYSGSGLKPSLDYEFYDYHRLPHKKSKQLAEKLVSQQFLDSRDCCYVKRNGC